MDDVGHKIKAELNKKNISIADLVRKTRLKQSAVDNIIYGRSKKKEIITKIAKALGLPSEYFLDSEVGTKFDHVLYHQAFNTVYEIMCQSKVSITREILNEYSYDVYLFAKKEGGSKVDLSSYAQGLVFAGIKQGILTVAR